MSEKKQNISDEMVDAASNAATAGDWGFTGVDPITGEYSLGHRIWRKTRVYRARAFDTADELHNACCEYFDWNLEHPLHDLKLWQYQGAVVKAPAPKVRNMSVQAMCLFIGISPGVWGAYRHTRPDLADVQEWAETVIMTWQQEHAAAGLLDAAFIARMQGMVEKTRVELGGEADMIVQYKLPDNGRDGNSDDT